jgi:hypothetical protein
MAAVGKLMAFVATPVVSDLSWLCGAALQILSSSIAKTGEPLTCCRTDIQRRRCEAFISEGLASQLHALRPWQLGDGRVRFVPPDL